MSDIDEIRKRLELMHPLLSALVVEMTLRPQGEDGEQELRLMVPRAKGHPVQCLAIVPAPEDDVSDPDERAYQLGLFTDAIAEMFERSLAKALREEHRPLEVVDLYEAPRLVDPRHFQCGDHVNLQGLAGIVVALDHNQCSVTVAGGRMSTIGAAIKRMVARGRVDSGGKLSGVTGIVLSDADFAQARADTAMVQCSSVGFTDPEKEARFVAAHSVWFDILTANGKTRIYRKGALDSALFQLAYPQPEQVRVVEDETG